MPPQPGSHARNVWMFQLLYARCAQSKLDELRFVKHALIDCFYATSWQESEATFPENALITAWSFESFAQATADRVNSPPTYPVVVPCSENERQDMDDQNLGCS